jgi:hypothetical protein
MQRNLISTLLLAATIAACQPPGDDNAAADNGAVPEKAAPAGAPRAVASPGKPSAPIVIDYTINGTPLVGHPVSIDLDVASTVEDRPVTLNYRVIDTSALAFPQSQVRRVTMAIPDDASPAIQQVTVIPQREGRLYLNVTAEIETEDGMMLKSMAIPIQVGSAPAELETNGELKKDADGDAVISLPANDG